jgi:HEAT repeat protein
MKESEKKNLRDCLAETVEIPKSHSRYLACPVIAQRDNQLVVQTPRGTQIVFTVEDNVLKRVRHINAIQDPLTAFDELPATSGMPGTPLEAVWPGSDNKQTAEESEYPDNSASISPCLENSPAILPVVPADRANEAVQNLAMASRLETMEREIANWKEQLNALESQLTQLKPAARLQNLENQAASLASCAAKVQSLETVVQGMAAYPVKLESQLQQMQQLAGKLAALENQMTQLQERAAQPPAVMAAAVQPAYSWQGIGKALAILLVQAVVRLGEWLVDAARYAWHGSKQVASFCAVFLRQGEYAGMRRRMSVAAGCLVTILTCFWFVVKVWPSQGKAQNTGLRPAIQNTGLRPAPLTPLLPQSPSDSSQDRQWADATQRRQPVFSPDEHKENGRGKVISDPAEYEQLMARNRQLKELSDMAQSSDVQKRREAAVALRALKSTTQLLVLLRDSDDQVCVTAVLGVGELRCNEAVPSLLDIAKDARRPAGLREKAMLALSEIKDERATDTLCAIFRDASADVDLRTVAAEVMAIIGNVRVCKELLEALSSSDPLLVVAAARGLGHFSYPYAVDKLAELLKSKADNAVRVAVCEALGNMQERTAESAQALLDVLGSTDTPGDVRQAARDSLQKLVSRLSGELKARAQQALNG